MHKESAEKQQQQNMVIELSDGRKKFNPKDPFCHRKTVLHDIKCLVHQMSFSSETKEAVRQCHHWQHGLHEEG